MRRSLIKAFYSPLDRSLIFCLVMSNLFGCMAALGNGSSFCLKADAFFSALSVILCVLSFFAGRVSVPEIFRRYSENLSGIKSVSGRWYVVGVKPKRRMSAARYRKSLAADVRNQSLLPPGRYYTLTHDTVLSQMQKRKNISIEKIRYKYSGRLPKSREKRRFYLVVFTVTS